MYQELPIDVVRPAPDNLRRRLGDVSDIVATIPTHGILEPLVVAPQDDGTYLIVAGHRRHAAVICAPGRGVLDVHHGHRASLSVRRGPLIFRGP